jgi:hypothetical protein
VILIQLRVERINLPLPKRIVKSVVNRCRENAEARSRGTVDHQRLRHASQLLIGHYIRQLRQFFQLRYKIVRHAVQFALVWVFQGVLILRSADAIVNCEILHRLHVKLYAFDLGELRSKPVYHFSGRDFPLLKRLEIDLDSPAVESRVRPIRSDEGRDTVHRRIVQ